MINFINTEIPSVLKKIKLIKGTPSITKEMSFVQVSLSIIS